MRPVPVVLRRVALRPQLSAQPRRVSELFANNYDNDNATPIDSRLPRLPLASSSRMREVRGKQASKRRDLTEVQREERSAI